MEKIQISNAMEVLKYSTVIKPIIGCILIVALFTNCEDFLNVEPENVLIQEEFWKTKSDVMSVVAATYDAARENTEQSFLLGEVRADYVKAPGSSWEYGAIGLNNISTTNSKVKWGNYYKVINYANTVMYYAPLVAKDYDQTLTAPVLNQVKSEMLFLRSLSYFYLVRLWKDVPLVLRPTISDTVDFYIPKSTEDVVLKQLVADLELANTLASETTELGHANKYAIQALLADVYLWKQDYQSCINYCNSISQANYSLESDSTMFNLYFPGNSQKESLFEMQYNYILKENDWNMYDVFSGINVNVQKMNFDTNDRRKFGTKTPKWKYTGADEIGQIERTDVGYADPNYIYYRYADVMAMKAEALVELSESNLPEANDLLEEIAIRGGGTATFVRTYTREDFRMAQLEERGREFGAEGKRWFDLLRVAKRNSFENYQFLAEILLAKAITTQELNIMRSKVIDTMGYFLPIHEDELKYNKNLKQNTAYSR